MFQKSFIFLSFLFSFKIYNIYSIEDDEELVIHYINFDLSDPLIKYKNEAEKIENIVTDSNSFRNPEIQLIKDILMVGQQILFMAILPETNFL